MMKRCLMAVVAAVTCLLLFNPLPSWSAAKGPIKIGFLAPLSGGMAANGKDMLVGLEQYLEEIKYHAEKDPQVDRTHGVVEQPAASALRRVCLQYAQIQKGLHCRL